MIIGKYSVDPYIGDDRILISWQSEGKTCKIIVDNASVFLEQLITQKSVQHCADLFRMAFTDSAKFYVQPEYGLVFLMPPEIPGSKYENRQLFEYYVEEFSKAFSKFTKILVEPSELVLLVSDMRSMF